MNTKAPRKKIPVKSIFHHVIRAKIYSILTLNALEGMMLELDHTLDQDYVSSNFNIFDENLRRFQHGIIFPTSHGDYLDRAVKSLSKELDVPVTTELANAQAVKKVIMTLARGSNEQEKAELLEWLSENNDYIVKSPRFEQLIDQACMFFYKKRSSQVSEDTLNFIRRSANELLRNKASKDAMKKRLTMDEDDGNIDKVIRDNDNAMGREYELNQNEAADMSPGISDSDDEFIINKKELNASHVKRGRTDRDSDFSDKRMKHISM